MKSKIERLINFITHDIWQVSDERGRWINILINEIKIFIVTFKNYGRHQISVRSAALTYYTMTSLVPIIAMILGVSKGFGIDDKVIGYLKVSFAEYESVFNYIAQFANSFLENSKVGIFAGVSIVILIWSVIMVFSSIEDAFNHLWEVKRSRAIYRRVSDYIAIIIVVPILYTIYIGVTEYVNGEFIKYISDSEFLLWLYKVLFRFISYAIVWLMFAAIYVILPNTKVKFGAAFHAGVIAGSAYIAFKYAYVFFQSSVSNYSVIYGSFAAIPLMLIWLNICWQIVLFGAELSFVYQNISRYEYEREAKDFSFNLKRKLLILISHTLTCNFIDRKEPLSSEEVAHKLNLPVAAVREVMYTLLQAKIIYSVEDLDHSKNSKTFYYTMAIDVSELTVGGLLDIVEGHGTSSIEDVVGIDMVSGLYSDRDKLVKNL